jgi:triphosphatase
LLTVKSDAPSPGGLAQRREWEVAGQPGEFDFSHVDNHEAPPLSRIGDSPSWCRCSPPTSYAASGFSTPQEGTRIEVALDRGKIIAGERSDPICEVELELLEGSVDELFAAAVALQADLPLHPEGASKAERGYRLAAEKALAPVRATNAVLEMGMTSIAVFRSTAFSCLGQLQGNERGVRDTDAPEYIHQARVAMRRLRSAIRLWRPLLPADYVSNFDPRWRTLANQLGDTRNWDVFITEILPPISKAFPEHSDIRRLERGQNTPGRLPQAGQGGDDLAHLLAIAARIHRRQRRPGGEQEATDWRVCAALAEQARQSAWRRWRPKPAIRIRKPGMPCAWP